MKVRKNRMDGGEEGLKLGSDVPGTWMSMGYHCIWMLLLGASVLFAQSVAPGRTLEVLNLSVSARDLGIAESGIAATENPFGARFNPASLSGVTGTHAYSYHGRLTEGVDVFSITVAHQLASQTALSLCWSQYQVAGIPITDVTTATPTQDIEFTDGSYATHALTGAFSTQLFPGIAAGLATTGWMSRLVASGDYRSQGFTISPGLVMQVDSSLSVGVRWANALSQSVWSGGESETLASVLSIGANWGWQTVRVFGAIDWDPSQWNRHHLRMGSRVQVFPFWSVSAGFSGDTLCLGSGIVFHRLRLDYAYALAGASQLSSGSRVTVGVVF